jgi:hypothetical protein
MAHHTRKTTIVDKLDMNKMETIHNELQIDHNNIFCGYLRQPIRTDKVGDNYVISGDCVLYDKICSKVPDKDWKVEDCDKYKTYFKR